MAMNERFRSGLTLDDFRGGKPAHEKRRSPRWACNKTVTVRFLDDGCHPGPLNARLVNCSTGGVGIITSRLIVEDTQFMIELQLHEPVQIIYTVRHWHLTKDGLFHIGAQYAGFMGTPAFNDPDVLLKILLAAGGRHNG